MSPERTPELRRFLVDSLEPDEIPPITRFGSQEWGEKEREMAERYVQELELLELYIDEFRARAGEMNDETFDRRFSSITEEIDIFIEKMGSTTPLGDLYIRERKRRPENNLEKYQLRDFFPIREVKTHKEFREKTKMYFEPRKEDICRLVFISKQLHDERVQRGEIGPDDPISIIDVGGASGALGALCQDVARENGLDIRYTIVDPHREIVEQAQVAYGGELKFEIKTAREYVLSLLRDQGDEDSIRRIAELDDTIHRVERKYQDFVLLYRSFDRIAYGEPRDFEEVKKAAYATLHNDFGIVPEVGSEPQDIEDLVKIVSDAKVRWLERERERIINMRTELEEKMSVQTSTADLVINSWMPNEVDFTPDIRMIRGAGIFYATSGVGDTGIQSRNFDGPGILHTYTAIESSQDPKPGYEFSYGPGKEYRYASAWLGPATGDKVAYYRYNQEDNCSTYHVDKRNFLNYFVLQVAKGYDAPSPATIQKHPGVATGDKYPWERGMDKYNQFVPDPMALDASACDYREIRTKLQQYAEHLDVMIEEST